MYQLRASVAAHAGDVGLPRTRAEDLVVAVHELAANVVRHGGGRGRLLAWRHDDELHCRVTDEGDEPAGADASPDGQVAAAAGTGDQDAIMVGNGVTWPIKRGHGLWLVRQLADGVRLQPGPDGPVATVTFSLAEAGARTEFRLARSTWPAGTILAVTGHLDVKSATELSDALDDLLGRTPQSHVILDLDGLTFWDSFGLAALLRAQSRADAAASAQLVLTALPARLLRDLNDAGLRERFTIAESTSQAIADATSARPNDDPLQSS
jgi:anti-anti-sigma factor